jgi:hypothetical protein
VQTAFYFSEEEYRWNDGSKDIKKRHDKSFDISARYDEANSTEKMG